MKTAKKNLYQDNWSVDWYFNLGPPEYEASDVYRAIDRSDIEFH
jgi:hypothetical protein